MSSLNLLFVIGGGAFIVVMLIMNALMDGGDKEFERRLERVGPQGVVRKINTQDRVHAVRRSQDSSIGFLNQLVRLLPNPDKLRSRLARTGKNITMGEYLLMNALSLAVALVISSHLDLSKAASFLLTIAVGLWIPHMVIGRIGNKRIKQFLASFPEAIDTMCRGLRSGLPVSESIASVGREMPGPVGIEFRRISDGVRVGRTLEAAMWEVARRIDVPEFRFLIISMAIQKETGGNLTETLGNLSDLIRRRRQLRLKIKAMSSEAKASAMIIGSLPFIMFTLLMIVSPSYMMGIFHDPRGKFLLGGAVFWMSLGWFIMIKMIQFEI